MTTINSRKLDKALEKLDRLGRRDPNQPRTAEMLTLHQKLTAEMARITQRRNTVTTEPTND